MAAGLTDLDEGAKIIAADLPTLCTSDLIVDWQVPTDTEVDGEPAW